jgi:alpha-N-arabinofuranosidase
LSTEASGIFTGLYAGLYATGNGKRATPPAYFDWFEYTPLDAGEMVSYWDYIHQKEQ